MKSFPPEPCRALVTPSGCKTVEFGENLLLWLPVARAGMTEIKQILEISPSMVGVITNRAEACERDPR